MENNNKNNKNKEINNMAISNMTISNILGRLMLLTFIPALIFLLSISITVGQVTIDDIDIPSSIDEGSELSVSFYASTDIENATENDVSYKIYINEILVSESETLTLYMNHSSAGMYNLTFFASDNESNVSETRVIEVLDVPLTIVLNNPISTNYNIRSIDIGLIVSTYADNCSYSISGVGGWNSSGNLEDNGDGSNQNFYGNVLLPDDGLYTFSATCLNLYDSVSNSLTFNVDTLNPIILSKSYSIDASNTVTLSASTDSVCACRYDTSDKLYDSMSNTFRYTNSLQHSTSISGLPDGYYTYYIKCKNYNNLSSNIETIVFSIITKPTAAISLSESSPLKAGTYEVSLTTSKPVVSAPSLYYTFDTDTASRYVTLTGSGKNWMGYMIIENNIDDKVGTFHYTGTDFNNNIGNVITDGELFLIDTIKPEAPVSVAADEITDGSIKLRWYYDGEEAKKYNIYRSTSDPEYVDYIDSTSSTQYIDEDVIDGITYYYRIAAVDDAGNDGALSEVTQATSTRLVYPDEDDTDNADGDTSTSDEEISMQALDTKLVPKVDQLIVEFNKYLLDIEPLRSEMSAINDPNKLKIISALRLAEGINSAKSTISDLITQADSLKSKNLKLSDLEIQLNKLRMDGIKAKSLVAEDIIIVEQSSYDQITQESDVDAAISEVLSINLSRKVLNNYSDSNKKLQDYVLVKTDIVMFKIKYLGRDDYDKYTLVKKVVTSSQEFQNVSIIEVIPKSFERKASDISFKIYDQAEPTIVKDDPVLRWDIDSLSTNTVYYMTNNNAEMSSAKSTKTIVLYRPDFKVTQTIQEEDSEDGVGNKLTGFVSSDFFKLDAMSPIQWMVYLGVGLIMGLSAYYVSLDRKEKKRNAQRLRDHKIIVRAENKVLDRHMNKSVNNPITRDIQQQSVQLPQPVKPVILSLPEMSAKLDQANNLINNFDYENARMLFNQCMQSYKKFTPKIGPEKLKLNEIRLMLHHLYLKLSVYKIIYDSRKHINVRSYELLKQDLNSINKAYSKLYNSLASVNEDNLDLEKKFIDYVANSRRHLETVMS
ncbi:MAG: fibronectin type III domain-containing protein [Candidatus Woesearchaeota archaeon]